MPQRKQAELSFDDLRNNLVAAGGGAVEIAIGDIAAELGSALNEYLGLATLKLQQFQLLEQGEGAVRLTTTIKVPVVGNSSRKAEIGIDARFMRARSRIGYTIVFGVSPSAQKAMLGDLGRVLSQVPMQMQGMWLSLSSDARGTLRVDTPGQEVAEAVIEAGRGYLFRLGGQILKTLALDQVVFYLANFPDALKFTTKTRIVIPVGPLLQFTIRSISIEGAQAVGLSGEGVFNFFGQKLAFNATIRLTVGSIAFEIDLGRFVPQIDNPFFKPLTLTRAVASFEGSLAGYAVGLEGDFVISGSGNGGAFLVKYAAGSADLPDLFELESDRLILSDLATLATGVVVALPAFLDRIIVLQNSYIYFAKRPGLVTRSGLPSTQGVKAHSSVSILGYKAYGEVSAVGGKLGAKFQFAPINLGNIIEISGSGQGSPRGFSGNAVGKNAIVVELDGEGRTAAASLRVRILGQPAIDAIGALNDRSLSFVVKAKLPAPLGEQNFSVELGRDTATLTAGVQMSVGIKAEWGFGKFRIAKAAQVEAALEIVATPNGATGRANVRASLGPIKLAFPVNFDPFDMAGLVERIRKEVERKIIEALKNSVLWLEAMLEGAIEFVLDTAQIAEAIGYELRKLFNHTAEEAAAALRQAGYSINNAYLVLEQGFEAGWDNIRDLLQKGGGFAEEAVVDWIRKISDVGDPKYTARAMAGILLSAGYGTERAIAEVQQMLKDVKLTAEVIGQLRNSPREVARFLLNAKVGAEKAAQYLAEGFWDLSKDALTTTLTETGYAAQEVKAAVENVWRESGRALENIRNELGRFWRRNKPSVTVRWRVKW